MLGLDLEPKALAVWYSLRKSFARNCRIAHPRYVYDVGHESHADCLKPSKMSLVVTGNFVCDPAHDLQDGIRGAAKVDLTVSNSGLRLANEFDGS